MCIARLKRLFKKKAPVPARISPEEMQWKSPKWYRRVRNFFRRAPTSYGYFNMPKFQNCPGCGHPVKRSYKTSRGATYKCRCGFINMVTHPLIKQQERLESLRRKK